MKQIITLTDEWIKRWRPCKKGIKWLKGKDPNAIKILELLIKEKRYNWANWTIVRVMTYEQYVSYAMYATEQITGIYEKKCPNNKIFHKIIEAAKKCIKNPTKKNKIAAVAYADVYVGAINAYVAYVAVTAYVAAAAAAYAADADAAAAYTAAAYADAADDAYANDSLKLKILKYGISLLKETNND